VTQWPTTASGATPYRRRRPERTLLYRTVQTHFETWLALRRGEFDDADVVPGYVEREFRRYLECGILAHGFARARCAQCGHDFLIGFSCKGRGVCPSCCATPGAWWRQRRTWPINMKTAKALGLSIPQALQLRADELVQ
jgi:hypothetical protein